MKSLLIGGHPNMTEQKDDYFKLKNTLSNREDYFSEVTWCLGDLHRHLVEGLGYEFISLEIVYDTLTLYFKGFSITGLCSEFVYELSLVEGLSLEFSHSSNY